MSPVLLLTAGVYEDFRAPTVHLLEFIFFFVNGNVSDPCKNGWANVSIHVKVSAAYRYGAVQYMPLYTVFCIECSMYIHITEM